MLKYHIQENTEWKDSCSLADLRKHYSKGKINEETWLCDESQTVLQYKHLLFVPNEEELLRFKAYWDNIEKALKELRETLKIDGRISQNNKAVILARIIDGSEDYSICYKIIQEIYPEYCVKQVNEDKQANEGNKGKGYFHLFIGSLKWILVIGILMFIGYVVMHLFQ